MKIINNNEEGGGSKFDVIVLLATRHNGNLEKSGMNKNDKVCNIYDLEANYEECISEKIRMNTFIYVEEKEKIC